MSLRAIVSAVVLLAASTATLRASACSFGVDVFQPGNTGTGVAPGAVGRGSLEIKRGESGGGDCNGLSDSCDDIGVITLTFEPAADEDSPRSDVGYRVDVVDGKAPFPESDIAEPRPGFDDGARSIIWFRWADGASDDQEPLDFSLTLTPVDRDGNFGPTSAPIHIRDGGGGCGCRLGARRGLGGLVLASTGLVALVLRRRSRR